MTKPTPREKLSKIKFPSIKEKRSTGSVGLQKQKNSRIQKQKQSSSVDLSTDIGIINMLQMPSEQLARLIGPPRRLTRSYNR